ncbi:uncharacterized protein LOC129960556 [Argiope bruennichi]|uniref:Uncharacterized protein n=1 Tax=Argiope bruennichi TaxID=94029 RepID=A0A8T0FI04_ARGBR|nr:uncharacterized protein LOC129960556 [Argiope bruennichi]KAF8790887.1 hypothetical protein HNY73_005836 [Argiope bruennichi]
MDSILLVGCITPLILFLIIGWFICHRRRKPQFRSSLVIAECLEPQVICRPVPCQHPYYRVISEYSGHQEKAPLTEEKAESQPSTEEITNADWYRRLSLSSIPRKSSLSASHTRRASDASRLVKPIPLTLA